MALSEIINMQLAFDSANAVASINKAKAATDSLTGSQEKLAIAEKEGATNVESTANIRHKLALQAAADANAQLKVAQQAAIDAVKIEQQKTSALATEQQKQLASQKALNDQNDKAAAATMRRMEAEHKLARVAKEAAKERKAAEKDRKVAETPQEKAAATRRITASDKSVSSASGQADMAKVLESGALKKLDVLQKKNDTNLSAVAAAVSAQSGAKQGVSEAQKNLVNSQTQQLTKTYQAVGAEQRVNNLQSRKQRQAESALKAQDRVADKQARALMSSHMKQQAINEKAAAHKTALVDGIKEKLVKTAMGGGGVRGAVMANAIPLIAASMPLMLGVLAGAAIGAAAKVAFEVAKELYNVGAQEAEKSRQEAVNNQMQSAESLVTKGQLTQMNVSGEKIGISNESMATWAEKMNKQFIASISTVSHNKLVDFNDPDFKRLKLFEKQGILSKGEGGKYKVPSPEEAQKKMIEVIRKTANTQGPEAAKRLGIHQYGMDIQMVERILAMTNKQVEEYNKNIALETVRRTILNQKSIELQNSEFQLQTKREMLSREVAMKSVPAMTELNNAMTDLYKDLKPVATTVGKLSKAVISFVADAIRASDVLLNRVGLGAGSKNMDSMFKDDEFQKILRSLMDKNGMGLIPTSLAPADFITKAAEIFKKYGTGIGKANDETYSSVAARAYAEKNRTPGALTPNEMANKNWLEAQRESFTKTGKTYSVFKDGKETQQPITDEVYNKLMLEAQADAGDDRIKGKDEALGFIAKGIDKLNNVAQKQLEQQIETNSTLQLPAIGMEQAMAMMMSGMGAGGLPSNKDAPSNIRGQDFMPAYTAERERLYAQHGGLGSGRTDIGSRNRETWGSGKYETPSAAANYPEKNPKSSGRSTYTNAEIHKAIMEVESGGNPNAISPKGAKGLMQVTDPTYKDVKRMSGNKDISREDAGKWYFDWLLKKYNGNKNLALAAYNGGFGMVGRALKKSGGSDWDDINYKGSGVPKETREYVGKVNKVLGDYQPVVAAANGQASTVERNTRTMSPAQEGGAAQVSIGTINIYSAITNAAEAGYDIANKLKDALKEAVNAKSDIVIS